MDILWPSNLEGGGLPRSLMALLPNQNHNAEVLAALAAQPMAATRKIILPLFFADPFLNIHSIVRALQGWRALTIAALPCVDQYGADFGKTLESLGIGTTRERRNIALIRGAGLAVLRGIAHDAHDGSDLHDEATLLILPAYSDPDAPSLGQTLERRAAFVRQFAPWATPIILAD